MYSWKAKDPPLLIDDFEFGTVEEPLDLPAGDVGIAFSPMSTAETAQGAGPLRAGVTADVATLVVAVDTDVNDNSQAPAVYAIIGDFSGNNIPTSPPTPSTSDRNA